MTYVMYIRTYREYPILVKSAYQLQIDRRVRKAHPVQVMVRLRAQIKIKDKLTI